MSNFLSNSLQVLAMALPIVALSTQSASALDRRDFSVRNNTSQTITKLYVSSTDSASWGSNILSTVVPSGGSRKVTFSDDSERCMYQVKAVYRDQTYDWGNYNLCQEAYVDYIGNGGDYAPK